MGFGRGRIRDRKLQKQKCKLKRSKNSSKYKKRFPILALFSLWFSVGVLCSGFVGNLPLVNDLFGCVLKCAVFHLEFTRVSALGGGSFLDHVIWLSMLQSAVLHQEN